MVQILNTGAGTFSQWQSKPFDPAEYIREAGQMEAKLAEYKYNIQKQREKDFLESIDVKTENMMYSDLQNAMKDKLDEFVNFAVELEKNSRGNLSLEDKMKIAQKKKEVEQWRDNRLNVAKQLVEKKQVVYKDMSPFDADKTISTIRDEEKNILNIQSITPPVMRFKGMYELYDDAYKSIGANGFYNQATEEDYEDAAGNKGVRVVQRRTGLDNEQKREESFWEMVGDLDAGKRGANSEISRSILNQWNDLMNDDKERGTNENKNKYPTPNALAEKIWMPAWGQPRELSKSVSGKDKKTSGKDWSNSGSGGGFDIVPVKGYAEKSLGITGGSLAFKDSKGSGVYVRVGKAPTDAKGNELPFVGDELVEVVNVTPNEYIINKFKEGDVEDTEATKWLNSNNGASFRNASFVDKIVTQFDGVPRQVRKDENGRYYLTRKLEKQPAIYSRKDAQTNEDVAAQLKAAFKYNGSTSQFLQWLDNRIKEEGIGSVKQSNESPTVNKEISKSGKKMKYLEWKAINKQGTAKEYNEYVNGR